MIILLVAGGPLPVRAQPGVTLHADVQLYGDNTEFRNPFREGETLFGASVRLWAGLEANERVTVALGALTNSRFGGSDAYELVRPMVSLTVRGHRSAFVIGTLPRRPLSAGPDLSSPHGLFPAIQRETLSIERPHEAGLQWTFRGTRMAHELWLNWQRLNTPSHRERFDAGGVAEVRLSDWLAMPMQVHVVHEGGQQFASGPVADSVAGGTGLGVRRAFGGTTLRLEGQALLSRHVPDRAIADAARSGAGFFGRASLRRSAWRAHVLFWRGNDYIKEEGDANYLSRRRNGSRYRGIRDYAEAGLTRTFEVAPDVHVQVAARLHRVERHYEYSYRILAVSGLRWRVR